MVWEPYLLELCDVGKRFGGLTALEGVSFGVRRREVRGIIGPNGAGKTTLFHLITGELRPTSGKILMEGEDITGLRPYSICRKGIGRTFQLTLIFPEMTVLDCVWAGVNARSTGLWKRLLWGSRHKDDATRVAMEIIRQVGLEERAHELASNLSYGDQKVLEIAMALSTRPRILLLDEPTQGVGPQEAAEILRLIKKLSANTTIMLIEHDMNMIRGVCDIVTVLHFGRVIAEGTWTEISMNEEVQMIYLGERWWIS